MARQATAAMRRTDGKEMKELIAYVGPGSVADRYSLANCGLAKIDQQITSVTAAITRNACAARGWSRAGQKPVMMDRGEIVDEPMKQ